MTLKEKIREILSVYHDYAQYYDEFDEWEKIDFNYDGKTFRMFEEDLEKAKEIIKDLEILEIIKKVGILDLVFSEDAYCNLVLTDAENCIDVDYDEKAPDIEMTCEDYEKFREWLNNDKK